MVFALLAFTLVLLGFTYTHYIDVFDEHTLSKISVQNSGQNNEVSHYELDEHEKKLLSSALLTHEPYQGEITDYTRFDFTIVNRFYLTQQYTLYFVNKEEIFLQNSKQEVFLVKDADFFHKHEAFDAYYDPLSFPRISIRANRANHPFTIQNHQWFFYRYDGTKIQDLKSIELAQEDNQIIESLKDPFFIFVDKPYEKAHLKVYDINDPSGEPILYEYLKEEALPHPPYNGDFLYEIQLEWDSSTLGYQGNAFIQFEISAEYPASFELGENELNQGQWTTLYAKNVSQDWLETVTIEQNFVENLTWTPYQKGYRAIIPTNYHTQTGLHDILIDDLKLQLTVHPQDYLMQFLTVSAENQAIRNQEAFEEYRKYFLPLFENSHETAWFEDEFILPTEGRLTTEFGEMRTVNNEKTSYRHNGIDIGAPLGTPVLATNHGQVIFSDFLQITGNTIVIDHGEGFFSTYLHLEDLFSEVGDKVKKGDQIATVGTTGFSTGPHLHFSIKYFDKPLEPGYFIMNKPFNKERQRNLSR